MTGLNDNILQVFERKNMQCFQGCIAVKNLFEFSIKVKFFRTTAREVKDKFF